MDFDSMNVTSGGLDGMDDFAGNFSSGWGAVFDSVNSTNGSVGAALNSSNGGFVGQAGGGDFSTRWLRTMTTTCSYFSFMTGVGLIVPIALFGLVGNFITVYVMWSERKTSPTYFLFIALAIADVMVIISWTWINAVAPFCAMWGYCQPLAQIGPYIFTYGIAFGTVFHMMSNYIVMLVSLQRLIAILRPLQAKIFNKMSNVHKELAGVVVLSLVFCAPRFAERYVGTDPRTGNPTIFTRPFALTDSYRIAYKICLYDTFYFIIPFTFLFYVTYKLVSELRKASESRGAMTSQLRKDRDTTLTLIMVVVLFLTMQAVNPVRRVLIETLSYEQKICGTIYFYINYMTPLCVVINSSFNFVIYCICSQTFRERLVGLFCPSRRKPNRK